MNTGDPLRIPSGADVMGLADITREAVEAAVAEFDALGRTAFLEKYGFGPARMYVLEIDGRHYDSKAIAGVAHRFLGPGSDALISEKFNGGKNTVERKLKQLGFKVVRLGAEGEARRTNPDWIRDELILALDLYLSQGGLPSSKAHPDIIELSQTLNRLNARLGRIGGETFRNPNGVYMTIGYFVHLDPIQRARGREGIPRGGKLQRAVWEEFSADPARLHEIAQTIRGVLDLPESEAPPDYDSDEITEAPEGKVFTRLHRYRERNRGLVETRKNAALRASGRLECEACAFDFAIAYGERGRGFIEAHHTKPVHTLSEGDRTRLEDLALLCANCHRMVHASQPWLTLDQLRATLSDKGRR